MNLYKIIITCAVLIVIATGCSSSLDSCHYKQVELFDNFEVVINSPSNNIFVPLQSFGNEEFLNTAILDSLIPLISDSTEIFFYTKSNLPIDKGMVAFLVVAKKYGLSLPDVFGFNLQIVLHQDFDHYDVVYSYFRDSNRKQIVENLISRIKNIERHE